MAFRLDPVKDKDLIDKLSKRTGQDLGKLMHRERQTAAQKKLKALDAPPPFEHTDRVMKFVFAYPISTNHLYVFGKDGKRHLTEAGKSYKKDVAAQAHIQGAFKMTGLVELTAHVYRPLRRGDLSNRVKLVEDGLKGIAWHDDEQVAILHMYRHLDRENPRIEIEIRQIHQNT